MHCADLYELGATSSAIDSELTRFVYVSFSLSHMVLIYFNIVKLAISCIMFSYQLVSFIIQQFPIARESDKDLSVLVFRRDINVKL
jgi:hypothetical protein